MFGYVSGWVDAPRVFISYPFRSQGLMMMALADKSRASSPWKTMLDDSVTCNPMVLIPFPPPSRAPSRVFCASDRSSEHSLPERLRMSWGGESPFLCLRSSAALGPSLRFLPRLLGFSSRWGGSSMVWESARCPSVCPCELYCRKDHHRCHPLTDFPSGTNPRALPLSFVVSSWPRTSCSSPSGSGLRKWSAMEPKQTPTALRGGFPTASPSSGHSSSEPGFCFCPRARDTLTARDVRMRLARRLPAWQDSKWIHVKSICRSMRSAWRWKRRVLPPTPSGMKSSPVLACSTARCWEWFFRRVSS